MSAVLLDKTKIKRSFSCASGTYDGVAELQRTVGTELLQNAEIEQLTGTVLDLGCGTGFLTEQLLACHPKLERIGALDLSLSMLNMCRHKLSYKPLEKINPKIHYICADAEHLPFVEHALDGVFSNLALQWCNHLEGALTGIKRITKPGGHLVFSTFGPETLKELKNSWAEVDEFDHVNNFYSANQVYQFLKEAGFSQIQMSSKQYISQYHSVNALMKELKQLGAHNVSNRRNKKFTTKTQMRKMIETYERLRSENLIPATFDVINVMAKA